MSELEDLKEALRKIIHRSPPEDWEPYDSWGDYTGYGDYGDSVHVAGVDPSNSGDVHSHGVDVGCWFTAKDLRELLDK